MRRAALALIPALALASSVVAEEQISVDLVRAAAVRAVAEGDDAFARQLSAELLQHDPADPLARMVLAMVAAGEGDLPTARGEARLAFRHGQSDRQRHEAAMLAASLAGQDGAGLAERYWLRRAIDMAPGPEEVRRAGYALLAVRDASPWSLGIGVSVTPSSNVNGGANSPFQIIDGIPWVGVLDGDAQAMSGLVGTVTVTGGYRIARGDWGDLRLTGRAFAARVALSEEAKDQAVTLTGSDLADTQLDGGLTFERDFADGSGGVEAQVLAGRGWRGTGEERDLLTFDIDADRQIGRVGVDGGIGLDATNPSYDWRADTLRTTLRGGVDLRTANGDRWRIGLGVFATDAGTGIDAGLKENTGGFLRLGWTRGRPVGPFEISASLGLGYTDFPDFTTGFIPVPGGRQDTTYSAEITLTHEDMNWMGFAPAVTFLARETTSNVSSFESRNIGVGFGLRSTF
jgi:hypothetical protein